LYLVYRLQFVAAGNDKDTKMFRRLLSLTLFSSLLAAGCQADLSGSGIEADEEYGVGIVGSKPDKDHPAVAALTLYGGGAFCSGVLINSYTVLTSARCIVGVVNPYSITVFFGDKAKQIWNAQGIAVPVWDYAIDPEFNPYTLENDIGLLFLWHDVNIPPAKLGFDMSETDLGQTMTYVGYRPNLFLGGSGPRSKAEVVLEDFTDDSLMYIWRGEGSEVPEAVPPFNPEEDCLLGSGSPAFITRDGVEEVVGINSYSSPDCESFGVNRRPSPWVDPEPEP
jgi:hypothetical protein